MMRTAAFFLAIAALALPARAQDGVGAHLHLYRLDCATPNPADPAFTLNVFSDTDAYSDAPPDLTFSCYLIRHGEEWLPLGLSASKRTWPRRPVTSLVTPKRR